MVTFLSHLVVVFLILDIKKFVADKEGYIMGMVQSHKTYSNKNKKLYQAAVNELLATIGVAVFIALLSSTVVSIYKNTVEARTKLEQSVEAREDLYASVLDK